MSIDNTLITCQYLSHANTYHMPIHVSMNVYAHAHTHIYSSTHVYICIYVRIQIHVYRYMGSSTFPNVGQEAQSILVQRSWIERKLQLNNHTGQPARDRISPIFHRFPIIFIDLLSICNAPSSFSTNFTEFF